MKRRDLHETHRKEFLSLETWFCVNPQVKTICDGKVGNSFLFKKS